MQQDGAGKCGLGSLKERTQLPTIIITSFTVLRYDVVEYAFEKKKVSIFLFTSIFPVPLMHMTFSDHCLPPFFDLHLEITHERYLGKRSMASRLKRDPDFPWRSCLMTSLYC